MQTTDLLPIPNDKTDWALRLAVPNDLPFIYDSWGKTMKDHSELGRKIKSSVFFGGMVQIIDRLLSQNQSKTLLSCLRDDPEIILGYVVYEPKICHFLYVKEGFRMMGIGKCLFELTDAECFTLRTHTLENLLKKKPDLVYNPFLLFKRVEQEG